MTISGEDAKRIAAAIVEAQGKKEEERWRKRCANPAWCKRAVFHVGECRTESGYGALDLKSSSR